MTQEEKQLLLKDLCARLPYGVKIYTKDGKNDASFILKISDLNWIFEDDRIDEMYEYDGWKPYLRPMSSMTEEEKEEFHKLKQFSVTVVMPNGVSLLKPTYIVDLEEDGDGLNHLYDWLNAHHFDYRGLIEKGLALEAPDGMYEKKK